MEDLYYIQNGWSGNAMAWWAFDNRGYTTEISKAKKFTESEARELIERPDFKAWLCDHVDNTPAAIKVTIDGQYLDRRYVLKK